MGTRVCHQCGLQELEEHMFQVEAKNKGNGKLKWKWSCYPCQGRQHPVEERRIAAKEREEARVIAANAQDEKITKLIAESWTTIYQREVKAAEDEMLDTLVAPFEKFDFSDVSQTNKRAYKQFAKLVEEQAFHVRATFQVFSEIKFNEDEVFLAEKVELLGESNREQIEESAGKETYTKAGFTFLMFLSFTLPIGISYGLWDILPWWQSLGVGLLTFVAGLVVCTYILTADYPLDFRAAFGRFNKNSLEFDDDAKTLHEVVLTNTMTELVRTNTFAKERLLSRFGDALEDLKKFPFDSKKAEREALISQLKALTRKDNFLDIASYVFLYKVAQSDGTVSAEEEEKIALLLDLGEENYTFANSLRSYPKVDIALVEIFKSASSDAALIESLIEKLFSVALADGNISDSEVIVIDGIGLSLGVTQQRLLSLRSEAESSLVGSKAKERLILNAAIDGINFDDL